MFDTKNVLRQLHDRSAPPWKQSGDNVGDLRERNLRRIYENVLVLSLDSVLFLLPHRSSYWPGGADAKVSSPV